MTFTPTNRPVPSDAPEDLYFNSSTLDSLVNGAAGAPVVDRTGVPRKNWATIEAENAGLASNLSGDNGASFVSWKSPLPGAIKQALNDILAQQYPTLETFGGRPDYVTDNGPALAALIASGAKGIRFNGGAYRFSDGIRFPTYLTLIGTKSPTLGHATLDDKQYLRDGAKSMIPGTMLIFSGSGTNTVSLPQRVGDYPTLRPCVEIYDAAPGATGTYWHGFAIVQDMTCRNAANTSFTSPAETNAADYQCGLLLNDVQHCYFSNIRVFGYFDKIGTAISSVSGNDDPDYNTFVGGSTMGRVGFALLGSNNGPATHGLSGTSLTSMGLFTLDHHSRGDMTEAERIAYYADANTWRCLYIDGDVDASSAEINGHYFDMLEIRTRANWAIELDHCSNVIFDKCVVEQAPYGITNSDVPAFIASANVKRGVEFWGVRMNYQSQIFSDSFIGNLLVPVIVQGDPLEGRIASVVRDPAGGYTAAILGAAAGVGDPAIQFTKDITSQNTGWKIFMDVSAGSPLNLSYNNSLMWAVTTGGIVIPSGGTRRELHEVGAGLTISGDAITVTRSLHALSPESGLTDDLVTINGGVEGMELILRPTASNHVITVRRSGNIRLDGSTDKVLNGSLSRIKLIYIGGLWSQMAPIVTNG